MSERLDVRKTYKLFIGGKFPRSESGRSYEVDRQQGPLPRQRGDGLAQGRPRRRRRRAQGVPRLVGRPRRTTAARCSTGWPSCSRAAARSSSTRSPPARASRAARPRRVVDAAIDRWVWYAGWSDKIAQVHGLGQPGRRAVLRLLGAGADRRRGRARPAGLVAARPGLGGRAGDRHAATPSSSWPARRGPLPAVTLSEVLATSDVPGGVVNVLTGRTAEVAPWLASHMDVNAIDLAGAAEADRRRPARSRPPTTSSGSLRPERADWTRTPDLTRLLRPPRDQDGLAPDRGLTLPIASRR